MVARETNEPVVPMHEEPRHRLVHESPGLRVVDVRIPPGDVTLLHSHADPTLYVVVNDAHVATQRPGEGWETRSRVRDPGELTDRCDYFTDPLVHRVRNDGPGMFHLIGVVNTSAGEHGLVADPRAELVTRWFVARRTDGVDERVTDTTRVFIQPASGTWLVAPAAEAPGRLGPGPTVEIQVGRPR